MADAGTLPASRISGFSNAIVTLGPTIQARVIESYAKLPLSFEANEGQAGSQVKFIARGRGYTLFLTSTEAVLSLRRAEGKVRTYGQKLKPRRLTAGKTTGALLRRKLVGSNPAPQATGLEELPGKSNYFIGSDPTRWRTNIPTYSRVMFKHVYPGVDLVYHGEQGRLKYDFVVAPGADLKAIRLALTPGPSARAYGRQAGPSPAPGDRGWPRSAGPGEGTHIGAPLRIASNGDLIIETEVGDVRLHKPIAYQEVDGRRDLVECEYWLAPAGHVGFRVGAYDPSRRLVIDPVLSYSSYLGGSLGDEGASIAVDSANNMYVTGRTLSETNFPTQTPLRSSGSVADVFVAKVNSAGSALLYSTYLGGSDLDEGRSIAIDSSGNAYVTGRTFSPDFPITTAPPDPAGALQPTYGSAGDAFVTKINDTGSALLYSTFLGGACSDDATGIAVDGAGNAYVTGSTCSDTFPTTSSAFRVLRPSGGSLTSAFVTKLNPAASGSASLVYSTFLGGGNESLGSGIAVDSQGNAYVTGQTKATNFPSTLEAFDRGCGSDNLCDSGSFSDAFVAKLNPAASGTASLVYSTFLGGGDTDKADAIAVDGTGNAYVTGFTKSPNFPATGTAFRTDLSGSGFDAFVTKLAPDGTACLLHLPRRRRL